MRKSVTALFVAIACILSEAQTSNIGFDIDFAQFAFDPDSNIVEFYYLFDTASMLKIREDSLTYVDGLLTISVTDSAAGKIIIQRQWRFKNPYPDSTGLNQNLVGVLSFVIPRGVYNCTFSGSNFYDTLGARTYTEIIDVNPFIKDKIGLSNIELASKILPESQNKNSLFYKNTYEVIPVPNVLFGDNQPVLFYYLELYNLKSTPEQVPLALLTRMFDSRGNVVVDRKMKLMHKEDSRVEVGSINVNKLPTGAYTLSLFLVDSVNNYGISSTKKLFVYNKGIVVEDTLVPEDTKSLTARFYALSEEELDEIFSKSQYIASGNEKDQYKDLGTPDAKREFLQRFWNTRDPDPSTQRNEFYEDYFKRIEYVNQKFSTSTISGWKTDRGRIYVEYGPPTEIDRFPNVSNTKPYEIWRYNELEGGVEFIFGDLIGLSNYQLIHSTKRGEISDPNWERRIRAL